MKWVNKENTTVSTDFIFEPTYLPDAIKVITDLNTSEDGTFIPTSHLNEVTDIYTFENFRLLIAVPTASKIFQRFECRFNNSL